jgi:hypothetical protein
VHVGFPCCDCSEKGCARVEEHRRSDIPPPAPWGFRLGSGLSSYQVRISQTYFG